MNIFRTYRARVGGEMKDFDSIGLLQATALSLVGLRAGMRILDVGAGCLRGGKWIIPLSMPGSYYPIEPNESLFKKGMNKELDRLKLKEKEIKRLWENYSSSPLFLDGIWPIPRFVKDYILAHSLLTQATRQQTENFFDNCHRNLTAEGSIVFTVNLSHSTVFPKEQNGMETTWNEAELRAFLFNKGWLACKMGLPHPLFQTYFHAQKRDAIK